LPASLVGVTALVLASAGAAGEDYRLTAAPAGPEETALRETLARGGPGLPDALSRLSAAHPGTAISGLAQLAAGLALLDAQKAKESLPYLVHPDIQRTLLWDHATIAFGRAEEALQQADAATQSYLAAAASNSGPVACDALGRAGEVFARTNQALKAVEVFERQATGCPADAPKALQRLGEIHESRGDRASAAAAYDRLDRDFPTSAAAHDTAARLTALAALLPPASPADRAARGLPAGLALLEAGRNTDAVRAFRSIPPGVLSAEDADLVRVSQARALLALGRAIEAQAALAPIKPDSPHAAEAGLYRARIKDRWSRSTGGYRQVLQDFPGTRWAEESLLALANEFQKDARDEEALPYWRRLLAEYPDGKYVERACWRTAWADYQAGRYEAAAQALERTVRLRPATASTPGFLYWAGRSRAALGQVDRARQLFEEAVQRYKHTYHGLRARDALPRLPAAPASPSPALLASTSAEPEPGVPEPQATRLRQLLLIDRLDEAQVELEALPHSRQGQATVAWIDWRRGRLRPAIVAMKRAFPEWIGEAGDRLPAEVWRILFPLRFDESLRAKAAEEGLDPSLVAALILQESTFDADALSRAGARGLMQVIPATGRKLARDLRVPYRKAALHDPETSLDFGTRYLRQMSDRFEGQVERVLAAYNAGPHRVDAWTAGRPQISAEDFVESIPFTETRFYVMVVLANRDQYRRLYGLDKPTTVVPLAQGARP
jgi:soluble lytic murein transglycosylase